MRIRITITRTRVRWNVFKSDKLIYQRIFIGVGKENFAKKLVASCNIFAKVLRGYNIFIIIDVYTCNFEMKKYFIRTMEYALGRIHSSFLRATNFPVNVANRKAHISKVTLHLAGGMWLVVYACISFRCNAARRSC